MSRPSWTDYFMSYAFLASTRATCDRKHVGAAIVSPANVIISTGYNGSPAGMPHCDDVGHEMREIDGRMSCVRTLHAESNALDAAGLQQAAGAVLYVTVIPCYDCIKRIINARIREVWYGDYYASRNTDLVADLCEQAGVPLKRWEGQLIALGGVE